MEQVRMLVAYYKITGNTTLEELRADKLITHEEFARCNQWCMRTVGQVYAWVESNNLAERQDDYKKHTVQRMLKIASFRNPELARLIPTVKFSGIWRVNRDARSPQAGGEARHGLVDVKVGDVLRWNYTREEGVVTGFGTEGGILVRLSDGTEIAFENDPRLFQRIDGVSP